MNRSDLKSHCYNYVLWKYYYAVPAESQSFQIRWIIESTIPDGPDSTKIDTYMSKNKLLTSSFEILPHEGHGRQLIWVESIGPDCPHRPRMRDNTYYNEVLKFCNRQLALHAVLYVDSRFVFLPWEGQSCQWCTIESPIPDGHNNPDIYREIIWI